ncbi:MAG: DUF4199 domain-containing protein [Mucilaginibacter sp.]
METNKPSQSSVAFKWAIFSFLTSIIITYGFEFAGVSQTSPLKYLGLIPYIAFLFLAQKEYRDKIGGFMTYGQGFMTGFLFAIYSGIFSAVFIFIYYKFLSPAVYEELLKGMRDQMISKGTPEETVDSVLGITGSITFLTIATLIGGIISGTIISLIGAAIFKKERSVLDIEQSNNYSDPAV